MSFSRYPSIDKHFSLDQLIGNIYSYDKKSVEFIMNKKSIEIDKDTKISMSLLIFLPINKVIISDIKEEITIGYLVVLYDLSKLDQQLKTISLYSYLVTFILSIFSIIVSLFMIFQFYKPIEYLRKLTLQLSKSKFNFSKESFWFSEFNYLVDSFLKMSQALEQQLAMLEAVASLDPLTKLYNRRAFEKFYNAIFIETKLNLTLGLIKNFAVIMMDIDNFKNINDSYGHDIGDKVLSTVAQIIKDRKRKTDITARYGGEEFIIILDVNNKEDALKFCINIKNIINSTSIEIDQNNKINVTCSFGISFYPEDSIDKDGLIKIADDNL